MAMLLQSRPHVGVQLRANKQAVPRVSPALRAFSGQQRLPGQVRPSARAQAATTRIHPRAAIWVALALAAAA
jgi:hypothetical protein